MIYKNIFYKLLFKIISGLTQTNFVKKLNFFITNNSNSPGEIKSNIDELLKNLVKDAVLNCELYKQNYAKLDHYLLNNIVKENIRLLPPLGKNDYKQNYKKVINKTINIKKLQKFRSSGSTGEPKTFYRTKSEYGWVLAALYYDWVKVGYRFGDELLRISMFKEGSISFKLFNYLSNTSYIALDEFNENKINQIINALGRKKFDYIYSYSGAIYIISDYCSKHKISFTGLKGIIAHGDILFDNYREIVEKVFNCSIYDTYGGDGIVVSGQCVNGNYHINDTNVIVEVVDDRNCPLPYDHTGRILLTNLHNTSAPLIRYDIGDMGCLKKGFCSCGLNTSLMLQPLGRDTDIIYLSNGSLLFVHFFTGLFSAYPDIELFQIMEIKKDTIIIKLVVKPSFKDPIKNEIEEKIKSYTNNGVEIFFDFVKDIPLEKSNKRRFVISNVNY